MRSTDTLLDFIARELPDPSAELAVCRFEQLTLRAHRASGDFRAPDPAGCDSRRVVQHARAAGLLFFPNGPALLIAPGLTSLCRIATPHEKRLWGSSSNPTRVASLIEAGLPRLTIEELLRVGALEFAC